MCDALASHASQQHSRPQSLVGLGSPSAAAATGVRIANDRRSDQAVVVLYWMIAAR
jgi:hypothetical protein